MALPSHTHFTLTFTVLLLASLTATSIPTTTDPSTDFIRSSCDATLYPSVCFKSLSRFAASIHQSPSLLARTAISVALSRAISVSSHLRSPALPPTSDPRSASALRDCRSVLGDAIDQIRRSEAELGKVGSLSSSLAPEAKPEEVAWEMSNVQTWMSAALTNEDTCVDGFGEAQGGAVKADVTARVF
ncbi:hypothetical protein QJS04_geneDACA011859 [Acorus gramineus]|uniref:Pectinesterase inhibitor domain-containing protein n=1 Tax=Acorus gramineus TaxID=55184 RepID=A0AAV9AHJ2_ACOGR|nr:hypothetical protein QJS04_geneDACA011859 [Acorus gramineus]